MNTIYGYIVCRLRFQLAKQLRYFRGLITQLLCYSIVGATATMPLSTFAGYVPIQKEPGEEPVTVVKIYKPKLIYHIDPFGVMRDLKTGQIVNPYVVATTTIPQAEIGAGGAIMVGIVLGVGANAMASYSGGARGSQILLQGFYGGVAGYYGALATMSGPVGVVIYGTAVMGTAAVSGFSTTAPQGANCLDQPDGDKCTIKPY